VFHSGMDTKLNLNKKLLIPIHRCRRTGGVFRWDDQIALASPRAVDALPLRRLARTLKKLPGVRGRVVRSVTAPAAVRIVRALGTDFPEAYRIIVSPDGAEILAGGDPGAYYGVMTLRELVKTHGRKLPGCVINDRPDFRRRGVYMDCSRGKVPTVDTVKALVERLAGWKINELQLYFENVFKLVSHPKIGRGYSPYTAADVLEIQDHCDLHHVRLVGSQATFGHMDKILALREYQHLGELPGFRGYPGGMTLCPGDPGSIALVSDILGELAPLFGAGDFNICGDEPWELGRGRSKRRVGRLGVGGIGKIYWAFLEKVIAVCRRLGKRANIWADIVLAYPELLGELPADITLLNWEYEAAGPRIARTAEIAATGLPFMVCPGTSGWLTHGTRLANAMANVSNFAAAGRKYGAEGLLNTDWGDYGHRNFLGVSLHGLAHGAAHAWFGKGVDDAAFTQTFCEHTFGETTGRLARAIEQLGAVRDRVDGRLYHALVERAGDALQESDMIDAGGAGEAIEQLSAGGLWPAAAGGLDSFERLALKEMKLAGEMDLLACKRALVVRDIRAGVSVRRAELRKLKRRLGSLPDRFASLWMARNRKSRLGDNLKLLKRAADF